MSRQYADRPAARGRRARRGRRGGCLPTLLILLVIAALALGGGYWGIQKIKNHFDGSSASGADYSGSGTGSVLVEVKQGDTVAQIGRTLKKQGVVASVDAFTSSAMQDPNSSSIQVGFYPMKHKMSSTAALGVLTDPKNLIQSAVTIPEGYRIKQIVAAIVKNTKLKRKAVVSAIRDADQLGLPAAANGNPEGYLFPATYSVPPNMSARDLIRQMLAKTNEVLTQLNVEQNAQKLGLTSEQVLTVASILEYEASRDADYPKVARAIYNRLKQKMPLQSDATVAYANNLSGTVYTTDQQRQSSSPYNTYAHPGLPPGPIGSPGEKTIEAALHPANGPWLFWVVVNLRTGETLMATTYKEHLANVEKFHQYCQTSSAC